MSKSHLVVIAMLVLLQLAAGFSKALHNPQEVSFLLGAGFNITFITIFGLVQIMAALMLTWGKTRLRGTLLSLFSLGFSCVILLVNNQAIYAIAALAPTLMSGYILYELVKSSTSPEYSH